MDKALKIFYFVVLGGVALYLLPYVSGLFGFESGVRGKEGIISISLDGGRTFESAAVHSGAVNINDIERSLVNASLVYAATDSGLLLSRDAGRNWYAYEDLEGVLDSGTVIHDILVNPSSPSEIYLATSRSGKSIVYVTRDNFFTLIPVFDTDRGAIQELAAKNGAVYFALSDGQTIRYSPASKTFAFEQGAVSEIFEHKDSFASFFGTPSLPGLALAAGAPTQGRVTAAADTGALVFLGIEEKLYRSDDYGLHWTIKEPVAENRSVSVIRVLNNGKMVVVGSKANFWF